MLKRLSAVVAAAGALATAAPVEARPAPAPQPAPRLFGHSSLEGQWSANFLLTVEAQTDAPALILPPAEAKALADTRAKATAEFFEKDLDPETPLQMKTIDGLPLVRGQRRTRLVTLPADGRLPYTAAARREIEGPPPPEKFDNVEDRPPSERCLMGNGQPPLTTFTWADQLQILETKDAVVIHTEYGGDIRVVPFASRHQPAMFRSRLGDSIARWEGDTLVVETVGLPPGDRVHFYPPLLVPGDATVVERFTRVSPKELLYQFTVIEPNTYTAPWSGEFSWYATDKLMYEHACHEGNYSLSGILSGARHDEAEKAKAAAAAQAAPAGAKSGGG